MWSMERYTDAYTVATLLSRKRKTGSIRIRLDYSNFEIRIITKNNRISNFEFRIRIVPALVGENASREGRCL